MTVWEELRFMARDLSLKLTDDERIALEEAATIFETHNQEDLT